MIVPKLLLQSHVERKFLVVNLLLGLLRSLLSLLGLVLMLLLVIMTGLSGSMRRSLVGSRLQVDLIVIGRRREIRV